MRTSPFFSIVPPQKKKSNLQIQKQIKHIPNILKGISGLLETFQRVLPITKYIGIASTAYDNVKLFANLYRSIPDCPSNPRIKEELQALLIEGEILIKKGKYRL